MKSFYLILVLSLNVSCCFADPLLQALREIESGNNPKAKGTKGEVSEYQITKSLYSKYKGTPTERATRILKDIEWAYISYGKEPSAFDFYVAWNYGIERYKNTGFSVSKLPSKIKERATRYSNLVKYYETNERKKHSK